MATAIDLLGMAKYKGVCSPILNKRITMDENK
jgi:hypothetical protein